MSVRSAWLLPGGAEPGQTREDTRLAPVGTMVPAGELTSRPGVIPGGAPFAASAAGAMSLQVGIGRAVVQGTTAQGAYPVAVDAPETLSFDDGDALLDRIDTVIIRVFDQLFDVSGENVARVEVVQGEPLASPVAPTLDPACEPLWDVTVPAGTSAGVGGIDWGTALGDRRRYTVAAGGILPPGDTATAGAYAGQWRDNAGVFERWDGTAWVVRSPHAGETFDADLSLSAGRQITVGTHELRPGLVGVRLVSFSGLSQVVVDVPFTVPFTAPPVMSVVIASSAGETARWDARPATVTSAGFQIFAFDTVLPVTNRTWSNVPVHWTAWAQ